MKCRGCETELIRDEERDCLYCPVCHPPQKKVSPEEKPETKYIDVTMTEARVRALITEHQEAEDERIREIVQDELIAWTKPVTTEGIEPVVVSPEKEILVEIPELDKHKNWRSEAKELEIELYDKENRKSRLKADVITDIDAKLALLVKVT